LLAGMAFAQEHDMQHMAPAQGVGTVHFDNSCAPRVRPTIDEGVAYLYSFWFTRAREQFALAAERDPACAIAYWGTAMSGYEQISGGGLPEGASLKSGLAALVQARRAREQTAREAGYINAIAIIYDQATIPDHDTRVRRYSAAMAEIHAAYPADTQAAVLYGMSLLKDGMPADPDLKLATKSLGVLNAVLKLEPDNPGVMHFIIHATDNPRMAALGLAAARRYAKLAPNAPHALHMPSHIFARLGLWDDDIRSNLASAAAAEQPAVLHGGAENLLHALDFLQYAYLQLGDEDRAAAVTHEATQIRRDDFSSGIARYYYVMESDFPAHLALETGNWTAACSLEPLAGSDPAARRLIYWARAVGAGHLMDAPAASRAQALLRATYTPAQLAANEADHLALWAEVRAWALFAAGKKAAGIALLRPAADRQDAVGKGEVELPAREMIGDMLRMSGQAREALVEYRRSLQTDPGRFNTLLHAGEMAEQLGLRQEAAGDFRLLLYNAAHPSGRYLSMLQSLK
jgi:tetratricopeptide (TPR) repeat protein